MEIDFFIKLGVSLLVGFLTGVERQISSNYTKKDIGVRDLLIISLLGFLATNILPNKEMAFFVLLGLVLMISVVGYVFYNWKFSQSKMGGFTTFFTLPTVFVLSSLTGFDVPIWQILIFMGILILTLQLKEEWQTFIETLRDREVLDFIIFLIVLFVAHPLIPKDLSWEFSFYTIEALFVWKIIAIISVLSFVSHFFNKYAKGKRAILITSFFGGLVSSLATVYLVTKKSKSKVSFDNAYTVFMASGVGSIVRDVAVIYYIVSLEFLSFLALPFILSLFLMITVLIFSVKKIDDVKIKFTERAMPIRTILEFVLVFLVVIVLSALINYYLPETFFYLGNFLTGIISSTASIVAGGNLFLQGMITDLTLGLTVAVAIIGSIFARTVVMLRHYPKHVLKIMLPLFVVSASMIGGIYLSLF